MSDRQEKEILRTGISGFDEVLAGGLPKGRVFLIEGNPGSGKTTLAIQFLLEGIRAGEKCLYISFAETKEEVSAVASSHGWSLEKISLFEHIPTVEALGSSDDQYTFFHP